MHTFAMILDNPGEQPHQTRYRDPAVLRSLGYSDLIIYPTTGLSGLLGPQTLSSPDLRRWVEGQYDSVQQSISEAHRAGLGAWVMYDAPTLAAELVGSAMTCLTPAPGTPGNRTLCPASDELLDMCGQAVEALLARIDGIDGLVLRLGDTDAPKMPYLVGNDVYQPHCSRCASLGRADRLVRFTRFFYDLVVGKLGRKLIVRAWNVRPGGMHDNAELCQRVVSQLPGEGDDRLILSFKFTQTDFWRYQRWNPSSLVCGDRPIIYELQCQREFEGKGAVPNWQAPLWRNGMTELDSAVGLADVAGKVNLAGLWAWVRGGGWRGPYINAANETWIDANVYAVPKLAADPKVNPDDLARQWIAERLGVSEPAAAGALLNVLQDSAQNALQMFYIGPYARNRPDPWNPAANFIQDDQIDAEAAWGVVQRLGDAALDEAANEKHAAEQRLSENLRTLQQVSPQLPSALQERLPLSLQYAATLAQTLRSLIGGLVAYRRWTRKPDPALLQLSEKSMRICQSCWVHHTQRIATHGGPSAFSSDDLWDLTQRVIDHLHEGAGA